VTRDVIARARVGAHDQNTRHSFVVSNFAKLWTVWPRKSTRFPIKHFSFRIWNHDGGQHPPDHQQLGVGGKDAPYHTKKNTSFLSVVETIFKKIALNYQDLDTSGRFENKETRKKNSKTPSWKK
jgi:hypothetical protein